MYAQVAELGREARRLFLSKFAIQRGQRLASSSTFQFADGPEDYGQDADAKRVLQDRVEADPDQGDMTDVLEYSGLLPFLTKCDF